MWSTEETLLGKKKLKKVAAIGFPNNHSITKRYRSLGSMVDRMPKTDFRSVYKMTYGRRSPGIGLVFIMTQEPYYQLPVNFCTEMSMKYDVLLRVILNSDKL